MPLIETLDTPAVQALKLTGAPFRIFQHYSRVDSLQQTAVERGQNPDQIIRSILFRLPADRYLMALMPGERQVSWKALRAHLRERRISLATPQQVLEKTGYEIGAVTPFGLPHPLRILADPAIFAYSEVSLGAGKRGYGLILPVSSLRENLPNLEIVSLSA